MVGPAFTLRYMPAREDRNQLSEFRNPKHPQRHAIETCPPGHVLVMDSRKDAQNIELMILAGFCRNCLSKWYVEAAATRGLEVDLEEAREMVYGMPYAEWKKNHQPPATEEQMKRFDAAQKAE